MPNISFSLPPAHVDIIELQNFLLQQKLIGLGVKAYVALNWHMNY